jgi:hypothetical protein
MTQNKVVVMNRLVPLKFISASILLFLRNFNIYILTSSGNRDSREAEK